MALSDAKVRNAKPQDKPYKIYDGDGLYLLVAVTGIKCWRFKYQFADKEKLLALGTYPEMSLNDARDGRAQARKMVALGGDPAQIKKESKHKARIEADNSFEAIGREWLKKQKSRWGDNTAEIHLQRLETYVFPKLGKRPIAKITPPEVLEMLQAIEKGGKLETAFRVKQDCSKIFTFAIATLRAERNPVPELEGALETPVAKHRPFLKAADLPEFLEQLTASKANSLTQLAIRLTILTFVRSIELRGAEQSEVDFNKAIWRIPPERMKMKAPHIVPLSRQAVEVLREIRKITGDGKYLFPNQHNPDGFMTENTMQYAIHDMKFRYPITVHGFRSTASTVLNEHEFPSDVIERQLAHCERDKVRAAYNYAQYLSQRCTMMQWWADYLDKAKRKKKRQ